MFKWWKEWKERTRQKRREHWEYEQLTDKQKEQYFSQQQKKRSIYKIKDFMDVVEVLESLRDKYTELDIKYEMLKEMFVKLNNQKKKNGWKVIQEKDGETKWYRQDAVKYVSNIYTSGPENTYFFDVIVDGEKITFSAPTFNEAQKLKFDILDVERVEEYDQEMQKEMFPVVAKLGNRED